MQIRGMKPQNLARQYTPALTLGQCRGPQGGSPGQGITFAKRPSRTRGRSFTAYGGRTPAACLGGALQALSSRSRSRYVEARAIENL